MQFSSITNFSNRLLLFTENKSEFIELIDELISENISVRHISKVSDMINLLNKEMFDVIVMDSSYNEVRCFELCHAMKSNGTTAKNVVIFISNRYEESMEVEAFKAGADDFVIKPLRARAFAERVKIRVQRPKETISIQHETNGSSRLKIDRESYSVFVDNDLLNLSRKEFELLYLFASHPGKIFRRKELYENVWKSELNDTNRTIDVHILRLRKKLGHDFIQTQKGVGYRFQA